MTEIDDLAAIRGLMSDAHGTIQDNGGQFVLWGVLTTVGLLATYGAVRSHAAPRLVSATWGVLIALGWLAWFVRGRRMHDRAPVRTSGDRLLRHLWAGVGVALALVSLVAPAAHAVPPSAVPGLVSAIIGVGFLASSPFYAELPLRLLAICWWLGAILMLAVRGPYTLLLMTAMVVALELLPGALLMRRRRVRALRGA